MGDTYVIPFGTTNDDLGPGSTISENIATTAFNAIINSVAEEYGHQLNTSYPPPQTVPESDPMLAFSDPQTYHALVSMDSSAVPNESLGLYNAMWDAYCYLSGDVHNRTGTQDSREYETMEPEHFRRKFTRKNGPKQFFEDYVNEKATKIAGEVNAILNRSSTAAFDAKWDPAQSPGIPDAVTAAALYAQAHANALASQDVDIYKMPDLPGRSSSAVANFKEQCFMLGNIIKFVEYKMTNVELVERKRLPYQPTKDDTVPTNACLMAHSEPYAFMNKLTQYGTQSTLLNLKNHEISSLVPKIRLFKVFENEKGEEVSQEFHFDAFQTAIDMEFFLSDRRKRGVGVGIRDFTFSYEGTNPFSVKKSIFASLELFASSFDELFRHRADILGHDYRYVDLALKTGGPGIQNKINAKKGSIEYENLENLNFRIKAVVGWQPPPGQTGTSTRGMSSAINNSFVTLNLTPTIHKFNIQDDGSVTFTCQYVAYIEEHFNAQMFNIFCTEKTQKRQLERKMTMAALNESCDVNKAKKVKESYKDEIKEDLRDSAQSIVQRMVDRELIRYVNIPFTELQDLNDKGPHSKFAKKFYKSKTALTKAKAKSIEGLAKKGKELTTAQKKTALNKGYFSMRPDRGTKKKNYSCAFFYVSDLVDVILEGITERLDAAPKALSEVGASKKLMSKADSSQGLEAQTELWKEEVKSFQQQAKAFRKMRVLLGPVELVNQQDPKQSKFVNMGDLPVSLKYFVEWLSKHTINKASVDMPLPKFLNRFFKDFINTFLNDDTCHEAKSRQRTTLSQAAITSYKRRPQDASDTISSAIRMVRKAKDSNLISRLDLDNWWPPISGRPLDPWPVLNVSGVHSEPITNSGAENEINYLVYYAGRSHPVEKQNGDFEEDKNMGIHHYAI